MNHNTWLIQLIYAYEHKILWIDGQVNEMDSKKIHNSQLDEELEFVQETVYRNISFDDFESEWLKHNPPLLKHQTGFRID